MRIRPTTSVLVSLSAGTAFLGTLCMPCFADDDMVPSRELRGNDFALVCADMYNDGVCGIRWNLPEGSHYVLEQFDAASASWYQYRTYSNAELREDTTPLKPGFLYRMKTCRGKSGCTLARSSVWVPVLPPSVEEIPLALEIPLADGSTTHLAVRLYSEDEPYWSLVGALNAGLIEPTISALEANPALLSELPPMELSWDPEKDYTGLYITQAQNVERNIVEMFNERRQMVIDSLD